MDGHGDDPLRPDHQSGLCILLDMQIDAPLGCLLSPGVRGGGTWTLARSRGLDEGCLASETG